MTSTHRIALVLLAAGSAHRFGSNKLAAPLAGKPLLRHVAERFARIRFSGGCFAVASSRTPPLGDLGFTLIEAPRDASQSQSLAAGVARVAGSQADAAMIVLGDMPFVPASHALSLIEAFDGDCVASANGDVRLPPAIFGRMHFATLANLDGDRGAFRLIRTAKAIGLAPEHALDIDTQADLERARTWLARSPARFDDQSLHLPIRT